jgi:hypothetical protein
MADYDGHEELEAALCQLRDSVCAACADNASYKVLPQDALVREVAEIANNHLRKYKKVAYTIHKFVRRGPLYCSQLEADATTDHETANCRVAGAYVVAILCSEVLKTIAVPVY